jgi:4-diphosphocytidyl-2-C-methyl-D-erythritol kinase
MSDTPLRITSPAKLNLSLRLLGKREDGFHEIDTLMTPVPGLCDELSFTPAKSFSFTCDVPSIPDDDTNLVVKATKLFEKLSKKKCKAAVHLTKVIPHGAGLGGGSSNAAATLRAWNSLHNDVLSEEKLHAAAAQLGSDVPFFLGTNTARCSGRGEVITPVPALPSMPIVIFKPAFAVATVDAYNRTANPIEIAGISYDPIAFPWGEVVNDLEKAVFSKFIYLAELKKWLYSRPEVAAAGMSGSGSAMFAILKKPELGENLILQVRERVDPILWTWSGSVGG